jgi:hypothetical protein
LSLFIGSGPCNVDVRYVAALTHCNDAGATLLS